MFFCFNLRILFLKIFYHFILIIWYFPLHIIIIFDIINIYSLSIKFLFFLLFFLQSDHKKVLNTHIFRFQILFVNLKKYKFWHCIFVSIFILSFLTVFFCLFYRKFYLHTHFDIYFGWLIQLKQFFKNICWTFFQSNGENKGFKILCFKFKVLNETSEDHRINHSFKKMNMRIFLTINKITSQHF